MKKQHAPNKGNKDGLPLPVTPRTMQEEVGLLTHEFRTCVDRMYKEQLPWGTGHLLAPDVWGGLSQPDERTNDAGRQTVEWAKARFDAFHAAFKQFRDRHEKDPSLREALGELLVVVNDYAFQDKPVFREDGSLDDDASDVRFGFEGSSLVEDWADLDIDVRAWVNKREVILLAERDRLADTIRAMLRELPARTSAATTRKDAKTAATPRSLASKFDAVPGSLDKFMALLRSKGIVDAADQYIPGHGQKSRLLGAYEGAAENLKFSTGTLDETVTMLNAAFPNLSLSPARPQDLRGTVGHTMMRAAFKVAALS